MVQSRLRHTGQWGRSMQTCQPLGCEVERKGRGRGAGLRAPRSQFHPKTGWEPHTLGGEVLCLSPVGVSMRSPGPGQP